MNIKKTKTQHVRVLITSIAIGLSLFLSSYSSSDESATIEFKGYWPSSAAERSLPIIPVTAYLIDNYIQVLNDKPDCDIAINIIDCTTGEVVFQQTVPQSATSNFNIPVINFPSGEYILELIGPNTRYLKGIFDI